MVRQRIDGTEIPDTRNRWQKLYDELYAPKLPEYYRSVEEERRLLSQPVEKTEKINRLEFRGDKSSGVFVLTKETKRLAGMNVRYVPDFSGGCSGLKKIYLEEPENE